MIPLRLCVLPGRYAVCRASPVAALPEGILNLISRGGSVPFISLTRTADETSLVLPQELVPAGWQVKGGWRCLMLLGPLDFGLVGVLAGITAALAGAGISLFALSTYDTDYILVREIDLSPALLALEKSGIVVEPFPPFV